MKIDSWKSFVCFLMAFTLARTAMADPLSMSSAGSANLTRPCSHAGVTSKTVAVSGTTARTTGALTAGAGVMVTCEMKAWLDFGASNNTAVADGTDVYVTSDVPYWFTIESGGQYISFIKKSGASDGNCMVSECR